MENKVLAVNNEAQKVIFLSEMQGQISDGMWENARPFDHYKAWSDLNEESVIVDPSNVGRNFHAIKDNYNLNAQDLIDIVGERVIEAVREATGNKDYSMKDLRRDIAQLRKAMQTMRTTTPAATKKEAPKAEPKKETKNYRGRRDPLNGESLSEYLKEYEDEETPKAEAPKAEVKSETSLRETSYGRTRWEGKGWYQLDRRARMWVKITTVDDSNPAPMMFLEIEDLF